MSIETMLPKYYVKTQVCLEINIFIFSNISCFLLHCSIDSLYNYMLILCVTMINDLNLQNYIEATSA